MRRLHKLLDFGLARAAPAEQHERSARMTDTLLAHTEDGERPAGTPHYMSPEQWSAEWGEVDARADLWAVGVLAYQMLTGRLPFAHDKTGLSVCLPVYLSLCLSVCLCLSRSLSLPLSPSLSVSLHP